MIALTRLNGKKFVLNAIYIEQVEAFPDTTITLTNGKRFVVRESVQEVVDLVSDFYRQAAVLRLPRDLGGSESEKQ
ncbi:flagellar FlbD family protein [Parageobacillus genomosp. 1]|jgi:flagellar protein FlbD|uniref:Flagellar FlbD family protein n=1 Tax=Parageobacillus genomosp. 1 TaxID=1295642 RepID=A0ABC9VH90_9BACL|nr:flagellar FlbD family protein [Parageobacillus genomosp. 1]EZP78045.1 flagellar FlbD family protein [Parageobacillus genomosp. 1]